ncbi:MAG: hypothetical protein ACR2MP_11090 [Streptosporangiaceae bacterium]
MVRLGRVPRRGLWDGYCIVAARHDGTEADLLSTRVPLRGLLATHGEILASGP